MTKEEKLQEAKRLYKTANADQRYVLESLFPELKESKDERIRNNLIELFHDTVSNDEIFSDYGLDKTEVLAWLEKQAPKPQGKTALEAIKEEKLNNANYYSDCTNKKGCINCENGELKETEQASKPEWSEEDEHHWMICLECVKECATQEREDFSKTIDWLKSIKKSNGGINYDR